VEAICGAECLERWPLRAISGVLDALLSVVKIDAGLARSILYGNQQVLRAAGPIQQKVSGTVSLAAMLGTTTLN